MRKKSRAPEAPPPGKSIQLGPLTARQVGNDIVLESKWDDPSAHAEFIAEWIASKPKIKAEIESDIIRAQRLVAEHNPIEVLSLVSMEFAFAKVSHSGEIEPA